MCPSAPLAVPEEPTAANPVVAGASLLREKRRDTENLEGLDSVRIRMIYDSLQILIVGQTLSLKGPRADFHIRMNFDGIKSLQP